VRFRILVLFILACQIARPVPARSSEFSGDGEIILKLDSAILGEERTLSVFLPGGYGEGGAVYPILYLLDAESRENIAQAMSSVSDVREKGLGPEMIVVGVQNTNRNRDMIPAAVSHRPGSGGSREFLAFLQKELVPLIEGSYRTSGFSVLYGASNAGLFTVYALLESPQTFNAYIAASPMIGHCPEFIREKASDFQKRERLEDRILFMIYGTEDSPRVTDFVPGFQKSLEAASPEGLRSRLEILAGEGHVPSSSLNRGLRFVFGPNVKRTSGGATRPRSPAFLDPRRNSTSRDERRPGTAAGIRIRRNT
jgi:predicted alpha/beta superfamily hydrolase